LKSDYFSKIGIHLSEIEKENFTALSQHHGLATELLDISENPLVSLYFAVSDEEETGIIYCLDKRKTLDFPGILEEYVGVNTRLDIRKLMDSLTSNILQSNYGGTERIIQDTIISLITYSMSGFSSMSKFPDKKDFNKFILQGWKRVLASVGTKKEVDVFSLKKFQSNFKFDEINALIEEYISKELTAETIADFDGQLFSLEQVKTIKISPNVDRNPSKIVKNNLIRLILVFDLFDIASKQIDFPPFPTLVYKPNIIFDRLKNQQAAFIYQLSVYPLMEPYTQKIPFEKKFIISSNAKSQILRELDYIGINREFIFSDLDNTAEYVMERQRYERDNFRDQINARQKIKEENL
jgi:hypothetical protein